MCTRDRITSAWRTTALAIAVVLPGCVAGTASHLPPPGWIEARPAGEHDRQGRGAWVHATGGTRLSPLSATGELIACRIDSVWVLSRTGLVAVARGRLWEVEVFPPHRGQRGAPSRKVLRATDEELREWARFPQGIPPGIDLRALKPLELPER